MLAYWTLNTLNIARVRWQCGAVSHFGISGWYNTIVLSESKNAMSYFSETSRESFILRNSHEEDVDYWVRREFSTLTILLSILFFWDLFLYLPSLGAEIWLLSEKVSFLFWNVTAWWLLDLGNNLTKAKYSVPIWKQRESKLLIPVSVNHKQIHTL